MLESRAISKNPEMSLVVHSEHGSVEDHERRGLAVQGDILTELIVSSLEEAAYESYDGTHTRLSETRGDIDRGLFGDTDINELTAGRATPGRIKPEHTGCSGGYGDHFAILFYHVGDMTAEKLAIIFWRVWHFGMQGFSGLEIEG